MVIDLFGIDPGHSAPGTTLFRVAVVEDDAEQQQAIVRYSSPQLWIDESPPGNPRRFYRAK